MFRRLRDCGRTFLLLDWHEPPPARHSLLSEVHAQSLMRELVRDPLNEVSLRSFLAGAGAVEIERMSCQELSDALQRELHGGQLRLALEESVRHFGLPVQPPSIHPTPPVMPTPLTVTVTFLPDPSNLQEVWDPVIEGHPAQSLACFDVQVQPAASASCTAKLIDAKGSVVREGLAVSGAGPGQVSVTWDGRLDGAKLAPIGQYRIRLEASAAGQSGSAESTPHKIIRVGALAAKFTGREIYPLKFAFADLPASFAHDDFDVPDWQWQLQSLDRGGAPRPPPPCAAHRSADGQTHCYPIAAKRKSKLSPAFRIGGEGFAANDGISLELTKSDGTPWAEQPVRQLAPGQTCTFTASDANALPASVQKVSGLALDLVFSFRSSKGVTVVLGKQHAPAQVIYVLVSEPQAPWGRGTAADRQRPWVELLDKACTRWAMGAQTVEQAAEKIVRAVNADLGLAYDTYAGSDKNGLVDKTAPPAFKPISIRLREFLKWLSGDPGRPVEWHVVNCTCCGALVTTFANALGCLLTSSVMSTDPDFSTGFRCNEIIGIGSSEWHHPFADPADTVGGFSYHELAWTGAAGASDQVYDACLQVASDPIQAPASSPLLPAGMTYATAAQAVDDYRRRLVLRDDVGSTVPLSAMAGQYVAR